MEPEFIKNPSLVPSHVGATKEPIPPEGINPKDSALKKLTILVIDDREVLVHMIARGLTRYGQKVLPALSGRRGIEIFQQDGVDAVLCDLKMPGMDGWAVGRAVAEICRTNGRPKTPFILVTGSIDAITNSMLVQSEVDAVVPKPAEISRILKVIYEILRDRDSESLG